MIKSLPPRPLTFDELDRLQDQHDGVIEDVSQDGLDCVTDVLLEGDDDDHILAFSPRDDRWYKLASLPRGDFSTRTDVLFQQFLAEHYPRGPDSVPSIEDYE